MLKEELDTTHGQNKKVKEKNKVTRKLIILLGSKAVT
jgi:hypothetical protein